MAIDTIGEGDDQRSISPTDTPITMQYTAIMISISGLRMADHLLNCSIEPGQFVRIR